MLSLVGISKSYGSQVLLDRVDWAVSPGERVGLVGANGAGKSTLLRIVAGGVEPDAGEVCLAKGERVGYLPQEVLGESGRSVLDAALDAFTEAHAAEARRRDLEHALETADPETPRYESLMADYARAWEEWDRLGAYDLESRTEAVLQGLGFRQEDLRRDVGEFSGGWQMRIALARLLLRRPGVLLLDEPTNHLDLEARNWLEGFLASYPGAVVLVAHDRYFLDVTVTRITEVERGRLSEYRCNYTRYEREKVERIEQQRHAWEMQQAEIERMEAFIRKFRYQASKAKLVQSRVKQLEKMDRVEPPPGGARAFRFRLPPAPRSGRKVLELRDAGKTYADGDVVVYDGIDLTVERGERIALVGPNGAGKTTLMKLLAGLEPLSAGERLVGHKVATGYFAQDQTDVLDPGKTVLEEMTAIAPFDVVPHLREILGTFLFSGDDVHKPTHVLSGGERNRLALAKLLLRRTNCLLLDEPTNHLDLHAKDVLLEALRHYGGTIVIVSHDRHVLDALPTCVLEVGNRRAIRYLGNYEDYLAKKASEAAEWPAEPEATPPAPPRRYAPPKPRPKGPDPSRLAEEIAGFEEEQARLTEELDRADFYETHPDPDGLLQRYTEVQQRIAALYEELDRVLENSGSSV